MPAPSPLPPMVSIIVPVRNAATTLVECLESIRAQTCDDFELLAIDDGSEDESATIIADFARSLPRVRLLQPGRIGLARALNRGIAEARGLLLARIDADDLMHPDRLAAQVAFLAENSAVDLVATQVEIFPASAVRAGFREYLRWQNGCITPEEIETNLYVESPFAHPSVMIRMRALERVGNYRDGPFPEDYELWLRMHRAGCRMAKIPRVLTSWRESPARASRTDPRYARIAFDRLRAEYLAADPRLRHSERPIVIWGAGRRTRLRAQHLIDRGIDPVAWVDIDPRKIGRAVASRPVHAPEWLADRAKGESPMRPFVLVYVTNHGARELIAERLAEFGCMPGVDWLAVG